MAGNIFGGGDNKNNEFVDKVDTHSKAILTVTQRQKDLESSIDLLTEKIELLDHNSVKNIKSLKNDIKNVHGDLRELFDEIKKLKEFNSKVSKQLKLMSTKDEVAKLEKYIDLWNPMDFVTRDEMNDFRIKLKKDFEEIIEKVLEED